MFTFPVILRLVIGALMIGSVYAVLGMGYSLIYKATGLMNLAMGDFLMLGAFVGLTFYKTLGLNIYLSFILTFVVMFIVGYVTQRYLITVLLNKGASFSYIILCTAGLSMLFQNGVQLIWAPFTLQFPAIFSKASVPFLSIKVAPENLLVLAIATVSAVALHFFLNKTRFGTAMRASALDQTAASSVGIDVGLTKGITWGLSAALAGVLGMALGPVYGVYSALGAMIAQKAFAGAVTGGYGNIYGAVIGGLFYGFVETFTAAYVSTAYKDVITFVILIVILSVAPNGIFKEKVIE
ncbi:MAG: branched-chain amino acid ABC transporter permease [Oscillibacter sp.]|nr:branched-chain amino acid ABC transporter permease [Oscillibacter sp.]